MGNKFELNKNKLFAIVLNFGFGLSYQILYLIPLLFLGGGLFGITTKKDSQFSIIIEVIFIVGTNLFMNHFFKKENKIVLIIIEIISFIIGTLLCILLGGFF